jgi:predicted transcriptional regulator
MGESTLGEQELALLTHVADGGALTVGEVAETFGRERRLARSTVLTMMERLRKKGRLVRQISEGVYRYRAHATSAQLRQSAVERFVERHLGGSVSPFLAYLSDATELSDDELRDLADLVNRLKTERRRDKRGAQ